MRTGVMEDAQRYYNHEEEFIGLHINMGNMSNGRRDDENCKCKVTWLIMKGL
jgi:hypothetical protein